MIADIYGVRHTHTHTHNNNNNNNNNNNTHKTKNKKPSPNKVQILMYFYKINGLSWLTTKASNPRRKLDKLCLLTSDVSTKQVDVLRRWWLWQIPVPCSKEGRPKIVPQTTGYRSRRVGGPERGYSCSKAKLNTIERGHRMDGWPLRARLCARPEIFPGVKFSADSTNSPLDKTLTHQSSGAVWKWRSSWAPVPNKPMVSVDVKQHSTNFNPQPAPPPPPLPPATLCVYKEAKRAHKHIIVQELCESWGGCPELSVLTSLLVSVDVKNYWTMLRHWSQLVPNMSTDI